MSQPTQEQTPTPPQTHEEEKGNDYVECEVCGKKVKASAYKRHVSAIHGFITKEEFQKMREEVEKTIQTSIHSALQEHWRGHYKSLKELLEEGEKHAETCPTCQAELQEWLKKKRQESYKKGKRLW